MARELITTAEFAARVRAPEATVRYWKHIGYGPPGRRIGRRVLYDAADVDRWIDEHFTRGGAE